MQLVNFIITYINLLTFAFLLTFVVVEYKRDALRKELIFTPLIEWFKTSTLRIFYWWISLAI